MQVDWPISSVSMFHLLSQVVVEYMSRALLGTVWRADLPSQVTVVSLLLCPRFVFNVKHIPNKCSGSAGRPTGRD